MKNAIATILFPTFCLLFSFFVLISDPAFTYLLQKPESIPATQQLLKHFAGQEQIPNIFNQQEKSHLEDVTLLIRLAAILLITIVIACFLLKPNWPLVIKRGTLLLILLLLAGLIVPFDTLFTTFHKIFFPQGNWMFSPESTLIQFYPATFFIAYAVAISLHAIITAAIFLGIVSKKG